MDMLKRLFGGHSQAQSSVTREQVLNELDRHYKSLGQTKLTEEIEKGLVKMGPACLRLIEQIALDCTVNWRIRHSAIQCGVRFHDSDYPSFLARNFVLGKNPRELNLAYEMNGDMNAGVEFGLYREAKDWLEKIGYELR
jgi:hypothetical protein